MRGRRLAELSSERDVLLLSEVLVAKEYDLPLQQRRTDLADRLSAQR
jgi:hypothetical protein